MLNYLSFSDLSEGEMVVPLFTAYLMNSVGMISLFACLLITSVLYFVVFFLLWSCKKLKGVIALSPPTTTTTGAATEMTSIRQQGSLRVAD